MNCNKLNDLFPAFVNGELSEKLSIEVKQHLDSCSDCSCVLEKFNQAIHLLKPTKEIKEQSFYFTRLKQKMEHSRTKISAFNAILLKKILQPAIYLASLILAVYIGILIGSGSDVVVANQYPESTNESKDYIQVFSELNYLDGIEIEPIENFLAEDSIPVDVGSN